MYIIIARINSKPLGIKGRLKGYRNIRLVYAKVKHLKDVSCDKNYSK